MMTDGHHRLARHAGVFTGATMLSRILGYVRDSMVATFFGAGLAADAFYAAFRIANLLRRLLGEGALSVSFIPVFSEYKTLHSKAETQHFLNAMVTVLFVFLLMITALGMIFAPNITHYIAMGFERTPDRFALTVSLTRYMFPFILFISMAALITGVLNAFESFFLPALAPICLSLAEIVYLLAIAPSLSPSNQIIGLALSVVIGGFSQFFIHIPALWKKGYRLALAWQPSHEGVRRVGKLMIPATLGVSADQIDGFVDTVCASFLPQGSITALYYSNRVMQLPLALFGIALSQVSLPAMAESVARGENQEVKDTLNFALRLTLFMILPAMAGLLLLGLPIVQVLFQHGLFSYEATRLTNSALFFFSLGLFAYAAVKILASAFYAYQNTRTPVKVSVACIALNIVMDLSLMGPMHVAGLALSTAIASWVNAGALYFLLRRRLGYLGGRRIAVTFLKGSVSCALMSFVSLTVLQTRTPGFSLPARLILSIITGAVTYLGMARVLHMEEWRPFWTMILHRTAVTSEGIE